MTGSDILARMTGMAKHFANVDLKIERLEQDLRDLRGEVSSLRTDHTDLKIRLAILEEARNTTRETVRAEIAIAVAELRVRFAEAQLQAREHPNDPLHLSPKTEE